MKALVYHAPRQMAWEDWPAPPAPGVGEALVAIRAVGICGSDVHGYTGESGRRVPPMVMGHEATGEVIAVGDDVTNQWIGKRVIIQPFLACGTCDECTAGAINRCRNRRFYGGNTHGAMAERMVVPVSNLLPLPDALSFAQGTLTEPLAVSRHAVKQAGDLTGKAVLIAGCGPIGLLTLIAAKRAGASQVILTDVIPKRRDVALRLGADAALDPAAADWRDQLGAVVQSARAEVDAAFDAVGIPPTFQQALDAARPGGIVVAIGGWRSVPLNLGPVVAREIQIRGTFNFTPQEFDEARCLLSERRFDPDCLITDSYPLADGAQVFAALAQSQAANIKVVLEHSS